MLGVPDIYKQVIGVNIGIPHPDYEFPKKVLKPKRKWIFKEKWPSG